MYFKSVDTYRYRYYSIGQVTSFVKGLQIQILKILKYRGQIHELGKTLLKHI